MITRKCNACKVLYEEYSMENNKKKPNSLMLLNTDSNNNYWQHSRIDLCPVCMGKVMDILNPKEDI